MERTEWPGAFKIQIAGLWAFERRRYPGINQWLAVFFVGRPAQRDRLEPRGTPYLDLLPGRQ